MKSGATLSLYFGMGLLLLQLAIKIAFSLKIFGVVQRCTTRRPIGPFTFLLGHSRDEPYFAMGGSHFAKCELVPLAITFSIFEYVG